MSLGISPGFFLRNSLRDNEKNRFWWVSEEKIWWILEEFLEEFLVEFVLEFLGEPIGTPDEISRNILG